jgi:hypothetical protein
MAPKAVRERRLHREKILGQTDFLLIRQARTVIPSIYNLLMLYLFDMRGWSKLLMPGTEMTGDFPGCQTKTLVRKYLFNDHDLCAWENSPCNTPDGLLWV